MLARALHGFDAQPISVSLAALLPQVLQFVAHNGSGAPIGHFS
jgi:hypothetical protein